MCGLCPKRALHAVPPLVCTVWVLSPALCPFVSSQSQNHGEYVFDVKEQGLKEDWVRLLQAYTHKPAPAENGGSASGSSRPLPAR